MRKKTNTKDEDGFLSRWSDQKNRKQNPLTETQGVDTESAREKDQDDVDNASQTATQLEEQTPELTDEDMPDIEVLDEKSDYSGFLSPGVSDELRKLALRKLFRSKVFNVRDGLDDYDDDFRSFAALGDIITSDMKHRMELAEEKRIQAEQEALALQKQEQQNQSHENQSQEKESEEMQSDDKESMEENMADQGHEEEQQHGNDTQKQGSDDQLARQEMTEIEEEIPKNETNDSTLSGKQDKDVTGNNTG